jgi:hypothetical protein
MVVRGLGLNAREQLPYVSGFGGFLPFMKYKLFRMIITQTFLSFFLLPLHLMHAREPGFFFSSSSSPKVSIYEHLSRITMNLGQSIYFQEKLY